MNEVWVIYEAGKRGPKLQVLCFFESEDAATEYATDVLLIGNTRARVGKLTRGIIHFNPHHQQPKGSPPLDTVGDITSWQAYTQ